jgi:ParB-like chromosome segregation protein Spo0J
MTKQVDPRKQGKGPAKPPPTTPKPTPEKKPDDRDDRNEEQGAPEVVERCTDATTEWCTVKLDEVVVDPDAYCHRDAKDLEPEPLAPLSDSIAREGLQTPIEVVRREGQVLLVKGHRRVQALRCLAERGQEGFTHDMEVPALEVLGASNQDLLLRSVLDNEVRRNFTPTERIEVARKFDEAGVSRERAASALGVNVLTYDKDLALARNPWMLKLVLEECVGATHAARLLQEAARADRLRDLEDDLTQWVALQKRRLDEEERSRTEVTGKGLNATERKVRRYLNNHLVEHWCSCLRKKERLSEAPEKGFHAWIDPRSRRLRIEKLDLDTQEANLLTVARVIATLGTVKDGLARIARLRHEIEGKAGSGSIGAGQPGGYDVSALRDLGLNDLADEIERLQGEEQGPASEDFLPEGPDEVEDEPDEAEEDEDLDPDAGDE